MARKRKRRPTPPELDRRGFRLIPIAGFIVVCLGLAWFLESRATTTLIFVRHTDTVVVLPESNNPPLSELGFERAELLADVLQDIDVVAGVDAIYASDDQRTQQTAARLADRLALEVRLADPYDVEPFMEQVLSEHKGEIVLIVTHSDIIAPLVEELHGSKNLPAIQSDEYGNIYIVTIPWFGKVKTLRLRYDTLFPPREGTFSGSRLNLR